MFLTTQIFLSARLRVHYTRSSKDVKILALHNSAHNFACISVIDYDLNNILSSNFFGAIFKLLRTVMPVFHFSLSIYRVQEH